MGNPCANCTTRKKIIEGCCVQGHLPEGVRSKFIVQKRGGIPIRKVEVCEHLDPTTGDCLIQEAGKPPECLSFNCSSIYKERYS